MAHLRCTNCGTVYNDAPNPLDRYYCTHCNGRQLERRVDADRATAGAIAGAAIGGAVGGPIGVLVGGLLGALFGNAVQVGNPGVRR